MNSDYTYRSCPGCGFDSCICEHVPASEAPSTSATQSEQQQHELHAAQHTPQQQQNRPIKIKLNLASSILPNTNKSPPALLPVSHGSAVPTPHTKQLKKRGRPPKTGRFALPHSHSRGAYNPRGRAGPTSHKSNIAKAKHGAVRRGFASNKKKGGRGSYRHDDDDYYYDGSFPTFVTAISSSSEDDDDEMDEELAVYHHRAPPVVPAPVTGPRLGKELLVPSLPHQDDDDDEEDEEDDQEEDDSDASSDLTDPDDISIQASEERFIIAEERARVRRELMGQDDVGGNGHKQRFDWQATPSKRSNSSSSGGSDSDSDSESSSDEDVLIQDEDDDNAEDEAEADVALGRAATTPLAERSDCSSDSDDFDAAVFFASLDSDHEEKAAEADDDEASTVSDLNVPRMQDSAYPMPIVSQDGMLAFGDPLAMLDAPFDIPTAVPSPNYCGDTTESDDDDEQMDVDTDQGATEDEDGFGTDDGETTDDMDEDEIAEILAPRFATPPPQGVDPLALHLTPIAVVPQPPVVRRPTPPRTVAITPTTRPRTMSLSTQSISSWGSMSPPAPPALRMPKLPSMGRFESPAGPVPPTPGESPRVVVIDGTSKDIPSPFARKFRSGLMRGRPKRYAKRRYHSLSPLHSGGEVSEDSMASFASLGIPSTSSYIDIHDVLDEAILEDDEDTFVDSQTALENPFQSASESDAATHSRNLTRWDRVPMNTFRRTRSDATHAMEFDSAIDLTMSFAIGFPGPSPYSYGNALKSPGAHTTKWWEPDRTAGSGSSKRFKRHPSASMQAALAMSPMLFPMSGGSGDEGDGPSFRRASSSQNSSPHKIHRKKERRALKNRSVDSAAVKPQKRMSHVQRAGSVKRVSPLRL